MRFRWTRFALLTGLMGAFACSKPSDPDPEPQGEAVLSPKDVAFGLHRASLFFHILPDGAREPMPVLASGPAPEGGDVFLVAAPPGPLVLVHEEIASDSAEPKTSEEPIPPDVENSGERAPAVYSWIIRQGNKLIRKTSNVSAEGHAWADGARNSTSCEGSITALACDAMVELAPDDDKVTTLLLAACEQDQVCSFYYSRSVEVQCNSDPNCMWDSSIQRIGNRYLLVGPGEIPQTQASLDPMAPKAMKIPGIALVEVSSNGPKVLDEIKPVKPSSAPVLSLFTNPRKEGTLQGIVLAEEGLFKGDVSVIAQSVIDVTSTTSNELQLSNLGLNPCESTDASAYAVFESGEVDGVAAGDSEVDEVAAADTLQAVCYRNGKLQTFLRTNGEPEIIGEIALPEGASINSKKGGKRLLDPDSWSPDSFHFCVPLVFPDGHEELFFFRVDKNTGGPIWTQRVKLPRVIKNSGGPIWTQRVNKNTGGPIWTQKVGQGASLSDESILVILQSDEELSFVVVDPNNADASFQTSALMKVNKNTGGPIWTQRAIKVANEGKYNDEAAPQRISQVGFLLPSPAMGSWKIPSGQELPTQASNLPWVFQGDVITP